MAVINGTIPRQSFEIIEEAIGSILSIELASQYARTANEDINATVYKERFIKFDASTEYPAINVKFERGDYSNKDQSLTVGTYKFLVVAYMGSNSTNSDYGDKLANLKLQRLLGVCRAILENPIYNNLALSRPFVKNCYVGGIQLGVTDESLGDENSVCGYLEYYVVAPEYSTLIDPLPLLNSITQVKLYETDNGFLWGSNGVDGSLFINEEDNPIFALQYFETENGGDTPTMKFSELPIDAEFNSDTRIIVIQPNDSGGFDNYYATPAQIASGASRKVITADATGSTISDVFFANPITEIVTNGQAYIIDVNFTQDTGAQTITGTTVSFYEGQVLIAKV